MFGLASVGLAPEPPLFTSAVTSSHFLSFLLTSTFAMEHNTYGR